MQQPFDFGIDTNSRVRMAFNILAISEMNLTFLEDITGHLENNGVGTVGVNIFMSSSWVVPQGEGPFMVVYETGGFPPERTQNEINPPAYIRPTAQIAVYGRSYTAVRTMIFNAYLALNFRNSDIGGVPPFPMVAIPAGDGPLTTLVYNTTVDATPTELFRDGVSRRITLGEDLSGAFFIRVIARALTGAEVAHYTLEGTISNNAGTVQFEGPVSQNIIYESTPGSYSVTAIADDVNDALVVQVVGVAHWVADVQLVRSSV